MVKSFAERYMRVTLIAQCYGGIALLQQHRLIRSANALPTLLTFEHVQVEVQKNFTDRKDGEMPI